ncbi:hypothetical protein PIB30_115375, partial [Stylosanthes scabra]|nr:hypothetical protein [Stylosanthes scabra]
TAPPTPTWPHSHPTPPRASWPSPTPTAPAFPPSPSPDIAGPEVVTLPRVASRLTSPRHRRVSTGQGRRCTSGQARRRTKPT